MKELKPRIHENGMDYVLVEKTLGKFGTRVDVLNELPIDLQDYVGRVVER